MSDLEATVVHDIAGSMTSITGLAEIVAARPELPARESLIETLADEARTATRAVRDLQILRSIAAGSLPESLGDVVLSEVLSDAAAKASRHGTAGPAVGSVEHVVRADPAMLTELLARVIELGATDDAPSSLQVEMNAGEVTVSIGTQRFDLQELEEGRREGKKIMRPLALADLLLPRWGARLELDSEGDVSYVRFVLVSV